MTAPHRFWGVFDPQPVQLVCVTSNVVAVFAYMKLLAYMRLYGNRASFIVEKNYSEGD
jgi:hypothetical protein